MNNEELIARLLDGSITEAEKSELDAQIAQSPVLAQEVRELMVVENLLAKDEAEDVVPVGFLSSVENKVATIIAGAGAAGIGGAALESILGGKAAAGAATTATTIFGAKAIVVVVSALAIGGGSWAAFSILSPKPDNSQQNPPAIVQQQTQIQQDPASEVPKAESILVPTPIADKKIPTQREENIASADNGNSAKEQREIGGKISSPVPEGEKMLQIYQNELAGKQSSGDKAGIALTSKKIGVLYRNLGNKSESAKYLEQALRNSRAIGLHEVEAETLGEIGLLESAHGNRENAMKSIQECLTILRSVNSGAVQRWEKELSKVQQAPK